MTNPAHIAIFSCPEFGHVKPLAATVRRLVARGHRITWITGEQYGEVVRATGADLLGYLSTRPPFSKTATASVADLGKLGLATMAESIEVALPLAAAALAEDVPDLVLFDIESVVPARTLIRRWGRPGVQVSPYLASNEVYSLHAQVFQPDEAEVQAVFGLLYGFIAENSLDEEVIWDYLTPYADRNVVLLPRELQPHGETFDDRYTFIGHGVDEDEAGADAALWSPPTDAKSVALLSLGSEMGNAEFFRMALDAFGNGDRHVVMTLGRGRMGLVGDERAANVEPHEWLPHAAVLPRADVFVTHGGMGSVVEALYFGVPMVVVPHHPENLVNGQRLAELGLARVLPEEELSAEALRAAVDAVAEDAVMRERAQWMRDRVRNSGGAERAVEVLEGFLTI